MARKILSLTDINFVPGTGTLTIPKLIRREKLLLITNTTANKIVYNFADPALGLYSHTFSTPASDPYHDAAHGKTILVLKYNTSAMAPTDDWQVVYDTENEVFEPADYLVDAVGKLRTANPTSLIDTDFEYGIQNSKWETLTMIQNYPGFFGRSSGGNAIDIQLIQGNGIAPLSTMAVTCNSPHGLSSGDVISVQETTEDNADGTFLCFPTSSTTFTYTAKGIVSGNVLDGTLTSIYGGGIFDNAHIMGGIVGQLGSFAAVSDQAAVSRITIVSPKPHGLLPGTPVLITQKEGSNFYGSFFIDTVDTPNSMSFLANGQILNPINTTDQGFYAKPEGYVNHRPHDGGVIMSTGNNVCGTQTMRQTRRYFRYQSGKSIQFSTGTKFTPTFQVEYLAANGIVPGSTDITVTTLNSHNLQPGAYVKIEGTETSGTYNPFNGVHLVTAIIDATTFKYNVVFTNTLSAIDQIPGGVNVFCTAYIWKGASTRAGLYSEQDGFFFEYDGQGIFACRQWSTQVLRGNVSVIKYNSTVTGNGTIFRKQLVSGDKIVIRGQSYRVLQIASDSSLTIAPAYRGASQSSVKVRKTQIIKVKQDQWNLDKFDGTGPSGHVFDPSKMQMTYIDYSWYGAGTIRYGFRGQGGKITWCHEISNNNNNLAAYQRSGNLPARYEAINEPTKFSKLVAGGTAVRGSNLLPQDTVMYVDNVDYWPASGYLRIQDENYVEIARFTSIGAYNQTAKGYAMNLIRRQPYVTYYAGSSYSLNGTYVAATFRPDATIPGGSGSAQVSIQVISQECAPVMSHWGSSVIMDGGFDDDASFIFTAGMQRYLQVGGSGSVSATIVSRSRASGVATLTTSAPHSLLAGYNAVVSGVNDVSVITYKQLSNNTASLTTSVAHRHRVGQTVVVSGVDNVFNGTWTITGVTSTTFLFTRASSNIPFQAVSPFNSPTALTSSYYNGTFLINNVTSNTIQFALAQADETSSAVNPNGAITQVFGATQQARPLISLRVAPSADNGTGRNFGLRELSNNMQLKLYSVNILAQGQFLVEGILNAQSLNGVAIPEAWANNRVGSGSLAQIIYHDNTGIPGSPVLSPTNTVSGGDRVFAFYTDNGGGTNYSVTRIDLTKARDLGNSILNGDGSTATPGFPNAPDILTIVATNLGSSAANISAVLAWTEAQA
jgi:hypothetical protein